MLSPNMHTSCCPPTGSDRLPRVNLPPSAGWRNVYHSEPNKNRRLFFEFFLLSAEFLTQQWHLLVLSCCLRVRCSIISTTELAVCSCVIVVRLVKPSQRSRMLCMGNQFRSAKSIVIWTDLGIILHGHLLRCAIVNASSACHAIS